jgi:hypothetical protein
MTEFVEYCRKNDCTHCPLPQLERNPEGIPDPHCSMDPSYYLEMEELKK